LRWPGRCRDAPLDPGREVLAAIRAEQIRLARAPGELGALDTVSQAEVVDAIFEGDRTVYTVAPAGAEGIELRVFDHHLERARTLERGARVAIGWNAQDLTVFAA
ncbi:MAG: TOBE domain-containing protein, partial [Geminicoccaceae bacterium]